METQFFEVLCWVSLSLYPALYLRANIGIHDDPPVGTTMPAFAAYLCSFDITQKGTHVFSVDRGDAETRRSVLNLEMDNKGKELLTLRTGGTAVMFAEGKITV